MRIVTVGPKYQIVIPKEVRKKIKVRPGDQVGLYVEDSDTVTIDIKPKSWTERTRGMMKEAWKGIDTAAELEKMRNEWERKP